MRPQALHRRIVSRGDLPGSDGGIYNPAAVPAGSAILLLCRREIDYRFTARVHPEAILVDPDSFAVLRHWTLQKRGFPRSSRVEDFRLLAHRDELLVVHTLVTEDRIKPVISRVSGRRLELFDELELPVAIDRVEKNWVLFERGGTIHCLYRLDPLTIFARKRRGSWTLVRREPSGWSGELEGGLSNSTNLIPFMDGFLGFWHTRLHGRYVQGAFLLDADLRLRFRTGVLLDGADVREGFKPGVLYVSALVEHRGTILAFYGEGDAHTSVAIFDARELEDELRRSPSAGEGPAPDGGFRSWCPVCDLR